MVKNLITKLFGLESDATAVAEKKPKNDRKASSGNGLATDTLESNETDADLEGFVDYVVRSLVNELDDVHVSSATDEQGLLIRIRCNKDEIGRVIGKDGRTIRAIRSLVKGAAARQGVRASVVVEE